jgi:hypothetical protein
MNLRTFVFATLALLGVQLLAPAASAQRPNDPTLCPWCKGDAETMKKAGIVSHGDFAFGKEEKTLKIDAVLGTCSIKWIETKHFELGFALGPQKVKQEEKEKIRAELTKLQLVLPSVDPKIKILDPWLRAHLFAQRCEEVYARMCEILAVKDDQFPQPNYVFDGTTPYMGTGPHLGQSGKYEVLIVPAEANLMQYLQNQFGLLTKKTQRWNYNAADTLSVTIHCTDEGLREDEGLHGHLGFNLAINLFDGFKHYSYDTPIWLREGLAHVIEREIGPRRCTASSSRRLITLDRVTGARPRPIARRADPSAPTCFAARAACRSREVRGPSADGYAPSRAHRRDDRARLPAPQGLIEACEPKARCSSRARASSATRSTTATSSPRVRERYPNLPIIWGGWFPSVIPELYFEHGIADAVGIGQGELTFARSSRRSTAGEDLATCRASRCAARRQGDLHRRTARSSASTSSSEVPWHLLEYERYVELQLEAHGNREGAPPLPAAGLTGRRTTRRAASATSRASAAPSRARSAARRIAHRAPLEGDPRAELAEEIAELQQRFKFDVLRFQDANFGVAEKRTKEFCETLIELKVPIHWNGTIEIETIMRYKEETLDLLEASKCHLLWLGAETGTAEMQERIKKDIDRSTTSPIAIGELVQAQHRARHVLDHRLPRRDRGVDGGDARPPQVKYLFPAPARTSTRSARSRAPRTSPRSRQARLRAAEGLRRVGQVLRVQVQLAQHAPARGRARDLAALQQHQRHLRPQDPRGPQVDARHSRRFAGWRLKKHRYGLEQKPRHLRQGTGQLQGLPRRRRVTEPPTRSANRAGHVHHGLRASRSSHEAQAIRASRNGLVSDSALTVARPAPSGLAGVTRSRGARRTRCARGRDRDALRSVRAPLRHQSGDPGPHGRLVPLALADRTWRAAAGSVADGSGVAARRTAGTLSAGDRGAARAPPGGTLAGPGAVRARDGAEAGAWTGLRTRSARPEELAAVFESLDVRYPLGGSMAAAV